MIKIFTLKEDAFLKACFYGQIKKGDNDSWIIGDNQSFIFKIDKQINGQQKNDDDEYVLKMEWIKKEWADDVESEVTLKFTDDEDSDRKCYLKFKQTGIPLNDKHGNSDQADLMKNFWKQSIFKGLTVKY